MVSYLYARGIINGSINLPISFHSRSPSLPGTYEYNISILKYRSGSLAATNQSDIPSQNSFRTLQHIITACPFLYRAQYCTIDHTTETIAPPPPQARSRRRRRRRGLDPSQIRNGDIIGGAPEWDFAIVAGIAYEMYSTAAKLPTYLPIPTHPPC